MANRWGLRASLGLVALALSAGIASAQDPAASFPNKPIRMVVGFAAGGGNDIFARLISSELQKRTGWTVVVENKPGAGGRLSAEQVAREPADGYTILVGASGAMVIGPLIFKTEYDTLKSFTPVTMIGDFPLFLAVGADNPAKSVKDLVAWTKANADKANYATSSPAFTLPSELFKMKSGANGTAIPYKSSAESILGVISGNAAMTVVDPPPLVPQVKGGKMRALAVLSKDRFPDLPDVPTMTESGFPDVNVSLFSGFFVPAGTPKPIVDKLHKELSAVITETDVTGKLRGMAVRPKGSGTEEFSKIIADEQKLWADVIKAGNLKFGK
ncbi:Bug family tripartite tricarboxylate transporter substrate binding protein [Pseudorhodoplanes sp.]|uniref:Bug family tripartite tricarboxylate transporter substrate binding protein n=1 Tax=Pseudorhodoplanes sp. TaxID=1934341 RepID=UPI003D0E7011